MTQIILLTAIIILLCVVANRFADKIGMPVLLLFIGLGMLFGVDGPFGIAYDDFGLTEKICSIALAFVMFYGGFGTKWETARPVAKKAILLSGAGVVLTALTLTVFCGAVLKIDWTESFLIGAVLSSTDAASVFSILRSKKLALKYGTASLLEIESGSNDPFSYMLTNIAISLMLSGGFGKGAIGEIGYMLFAQVVYGVVAGIVTAALAICVMKKTNLLIAGMDTIFVIAMVLLSYSLPDMIGGNGYLSVYLMGIILGNSRIPNKKVLVPFFDGITDLAQIIIFFILGLLSAPHLLPRVLITAIPIALFLLLIGRPLVVYVLTKPFHTGWQEWLCISWAGLRGASSIVFAIYAVSRAGSFLQYDLFHIVFMVSLLSVAVQGAFLPKVSEKLAMIDESGDVLKTFNDYQADASLTMMRMYIPKGHNWENRTIGEVSMPTGSLALMIRRNGETLIPRGDTKILAGDSIILSVPAYHGNGNIQLREVAIEKGNSWCGKSVEELNLPDNVLIALIRRGDESVIPRGKTVIEANDVVVVYDT